MLVGHGRIVAAQFHEPRANEGGHNFVEVFVDEDEEIAVRDVAVVTASKRAGEPLRMWLSRKSLSLEITIPSSTSDPVDLRVGSAVLFRKIKRVDRAVPSVVRRPASKDWELRVDQELHAAPSGPQTYRRSWHRNSSAASRSSRSKSG